MSDIPKEPAKGQMDDGRTEAQRQAEREWEASRVPPQRFTREQILETLDMLEKNHMDLLERLMDHERKGEDIPEVGPQIGLILDKLPFLKHTADTGILLTKVRAEIVKKYNIKIPGMRSEP